MKTATAAAKSSIARARARDKAELESRRNAREKYNEKSGTVSKTMRYQEEDLNRFDKLRVGEGLTQSEMFHSLLNFYTGEE